MSDIPQCSIILPVRCRTTFTTNALASLIVNGVRKDHQIILVLDRTNLTHEIVSNIENRPLGNKYPRDRPIEDFLKEDEEGMKRVDDWVKNHSSIFKKYNIEVVIADVGKEVWLDHRRIALVVEVSIC